MTKNERIKMSYKKFSLIILIGFIVGFVSIGISPKAFSENKVQYIKSSFNNIKDKFIENAEISEEGVLSCYHIDNNIDQNITHYIIAYVEIYPRKVISSVLVRKEIELGDGAVEIYEEGVYKDGSKFKYCYSIRHEIMYRNDNCEVKKLEPVKIWDEVINSWLEKFKK